MKKVLFPILALVLMLGLALPMGAPAPVGACEKKAAPLYAGQDIDVGTVSVWNCGTTFYVEYETKDGWVMTETHLAVATSLDDIPQTKKGTPIPGKFDCSEEHDPPVTAYTYEIPLNEWVAGTKLFIAAHAVVQRTGEVCTDEETAWGYCEDNGDIFTGKNWATYFTYMVISTS